MTRATAGRRGPVVFTGPTIPASVVREAVPRAEVMPPVRRGDLYEARNAGADVFLIIDGSFSHGFAIAPSEIVDVLRDGARVLGCSSMGAIRAAECWPAGMSGIGIVYRLYKLGLLTSDDEVAVATNADHDHAALTHALVNLRYALKHAVARGALTRAVAQDVLRQAMALNFAQRSTSDILATVPGPQRDELRGWLESVDVKRADAHRALGVLNALPPAAPGPADRSSASGLKGRTRYVGHDPSYGLPEESLRLDLLQWLFGSGRYQRYIWPVAFGDALTYRGTDRDPDESRALLAEMIGRALKEPERLAARILDELSYLDEAGSELATWHAVTELAACPVENIPSEVWRSTREETALRHGAPNWATLLSHVSDGALFGSLPFDWVTGACDRLARARAAAADPRFLTAARVPRRG